MKMNKTKIALSVATATLTMAGALVSPQASADARVDALEAQVEQMSEMMKTMQDELNRVRSAASRSASENTAKVQELDEWAASVRSAPTAARTKEHLVSFRGGWMHFNDDRAGTPTLGELGGAINAPFRTDSDAYYYGGAFDYNINNDLFGMLDHTSFIMEFGLEYAHIAESRSNGASAATVLAGGPGNPGELADVNQLRINISPKIKFMHGSKLRPWIIPAGLDVNIISPPSSAITVLNTGMNFGVGADYELFSGIVAGVDGRYHHSFDDIDGVDTDGFTLGGSLGFMF